MSKNESLFEMDVKQFEQDIKEVQKLMDKAEESALKAVKKEMTTITFDLLGEGMRRAPIHQGFLRGSGIAKVNGDQTAHTKSTGNGSASIVDDSTGNFSLQKMINQFMGEVAFTAEYATIQHENQSFNHPMGGEAKYLENPLKEKSVMYVKGIADTIKNDMNKGGG